MYNTTTTPASVASRLTDEEIETNARGVLNMAWFSNYEEAGCSPEKIAAVLRDYVRLRRLENAVKAKVAECSSCDTYNYTEYCREAIEDIERLLAEAEKGEAK